MWKSKQTDQTKAKTKREMLQMASRLSYVLLGFSVWMAASLLERDSGAEWSSLLIGWAPALELKAIFFIMLYVTIRTALLYYEITDAENT